MPSKPRRRHPQGARTKDPIAWLLEDDNPSVRYLALTDLLGRGADEPEVTAARRAIMAKGPVPRILAEQGKDGAWDKPDSFYTAKYRGTVWQLITLAELMADGNDPRIQQACRFIVDSAQDRESGGFAMHRAVKTGGGRGSEVIPCLTGNLTWCLLRFGWSDHPAVARAIGWIATYQRFDDGVDAPPRGWPYDRWEMCWGRHSCHMGVVKALKALAEIPPGQRRGEVKRTLDLGVEYLLRHHIYKRSHDLTRVSKPGWLRFGFPLMYRTDALEVLLLLTGLGTRDPRMHAAIDALASKQQPNGRFLLDNPPNGRHVVGIEAKAKPSKWITLRALTVLKRWGASRGSPWCQ
jgi:hypothetical protein